MVLRKNDLSPMDSFNFQGNEVRTVLIDGQAWFVGNEVATILGYKNTRDALNKHVDDEDKNTVAIHDGIGNPNKVIISESGVYSLIFASHLPTSKQFKHWVTSEVLPQIRKTGSYHQKPLTLDEQLQIIAKSNVRTKATVKQNTADIKLLKDTFPISNNQQYELKRLHHSKVISYLGGKDTNAYEKYSSKAFHACWHDFKRYFELPRYSELPRVKFDDGMQYLKMWAPSTDLRMDIKKANEQINLNIGDKEV